MADPFPLAHPAGPAGPDTGTPPPWLAIIGIGEDGLPGLTTASRDALNAAEFVFGGPRHLELAGVGTRGRAWPLPFAVDPVLALRGRKVAVLASGDPFWHGVGGSLSAHLAPGEWCSFPAPSTFSLAAARLGWRLEETQCIGLHAAPFARLLPLLANGARIIALLRDGAAVADLAAWLTAQGFGASALHVLEALGGPRERIRATHADAPALQGVCAPVSMAIAAQSAPGYAPDPACSPNLPLSSGLPLSANLSLASGLPRTPGLPEDAFAHDGQITKRRIRALTLAALAPRTGELLWDIGAGSGSVSVEWCLAGGRSIAIEPRPDRAANIRANAAAFGIDHRLSVTLGVAPAALASLPAPRAVFIGGGGDDALLTTLWATLPPGTRLVANAVTLETETLLALWHGTKGGDLIRIELAQATPLGRMRGWTAWRPVVQWSVIR